MIINKSEAYFVLICFFVAIVWFLQSPFKSDVYYYFFMGHLISHCYVVYSMFP